MDKKTLVIQKELSTDMEFSGDFLLKELTKKHIKIDAAMWFFYTEINDWKYILVGLSISPVYAFCWTLNDRENWLFNNNPEWINSPTKLAEIICGALVYSSCYLICWG